MPSRPRPPSFADACARLVADPDADHSLTTTLAPVGARIAASEAATERTAARERTLRSRLPADVDSVLELGCGTGTLSDRLSDDYDVLGVDAHPALLSFAAARGAAVACGDPAAPPVRPVFDAACAFGHLAARRSLSAVCEGAYAALRPGGIFAVDALTDARAAAVSGVETYRGARYVLERSVDVARDPPVVRADYRATDRRTGAVGVASERTPVRVVDAGAVRNALEAAGFDGVTVRADAGGDGELVATAVRPVDVGSGVEG